MDKVRVIEFFDELSSSWDEDMIRNEAVINKILDNACISEDVSVLDVACGTGVLIPDYLNRKVKSVTAIDISPKMVEVAKSKFSSFSNVEIICDDVETFLFDRKFDRIMVYNAFPHFPNPERLIEILSKLLNDNGVLTVAHGMSKAHIDNIHKHGAHDVSVELLTSNRLADIFARHLNVTTNISDDCMYQVSGINN